MMDADRRPRLGGCATILGLVRGREGMPMRVRLLAAGLAVAGTAMFAGCTATGSLKVRSADEVIVDVTITHALGDDACGQIGLNAGLPLTISADEDESGQATCHVTGTVHSERLRPYLSVSHAGELLTASFNLLGVAPGDDPPSGSVLSAFSDLDLTVRFPGDVVNATGEVDGNTVHFRDPKQLTRAYGLRADALDHPGPAWSALGPVASFVGGVAVTVLGFALWRRRRTGLPAVGQEAGHEDAEPLEADAEVLDAPPIDELAPSIDEPKLAIDIDRRPTPAIDGPAPDVPPRRRPDDSVWAPPGDP